VCVWVCAWVYVGVWGVCDESVCNGHMFVFVCVRVCVWYTTSSQHTTLLNPHTHNTHTHNTHTRTHTYIHTHTHTQRAAPSKEILSALICLCADKNNTVFLVTGRQRTVLEGWFHDIPNLGKCVCVCVCVCVYRCMCVCERERQRERKR